MTLRTFAALIVSSSIFLAGCGDDAEVAVTAPATATTTTADPPTTEVTPPPTTPPGEEEAPPATEEPEGSTTIEIGPGAAEAPVIDAAFTIDGARVDPARVRVPAFLTLQIAARSADGRAHTLRISTPGGPITLEVPAGGGASNEFEGLEPGEYVVAVDGQPTDARLVVVRGAGPDGD